MATNATKDAKGETTRRRAEEKGRGRKAAGPTTIPVAGWKDVLWRVFSEISEDRISLIAAGATYYLLLALFPALAAFVSIYGFVADPSTVADHISFLGGMLPAGGLDLIRSQLQALASQNPSALSFAFVLGLAIALWSANSGVKTLFDAMNIVYQEKEKRGFVKLNLLSLAFTLGGIVIAILLIVSVGVVPAILAMINLGGWTETLVSWLRWPVLLLFVATGISLIYRFGPSRSRPKWRWLTWGAAIATVVWIVASIGFSIYLTNFADYNATYGSLGAVIGFMVWTWISIIILLIGAELNAELEHQTSEDTTIGRPEVIGARGAVMADTIGRSADEEA